MKNLTTLPRRLTAALLLILPAPAAGQHAPAAAAPRPQAEAPDPRRAAAVSLLVSLADEARDYRDPALRVRVLALAADALYVPERERSRALFRRAWEEAGSADDESARKAEEARREFMAGRGGGLGLIPRASNLRGGVINLAARRDRALAEEFITSLAEKKADQAEAPQPRPRHPAEAEAEASQRLDLASRLLSDGDVARALQFADPALAGPATLPAVRFLEELREKDPASADSRFLSMLARARLDPSADANTVSVLSSYAFTPGLVIWYGRDGGAGSSNWDGAGRPPDLAPQLRAAFFAAAGDVLLRPLPPADGDPTTAGRAGLYMVITRLLPLFARYAPGKVPELEARRAQLATDTPEKARTSPSLARGLVDEAQASSAAREDLEERLKRARDDAERDELYLAAAVAAAGKKDGRPEEFAGKISAPETRRKVEAYLDFMAARAAVERRDPEAALAFLKRESLTPLVRVWLLTECAGLLAAAGEADRAPGLLEEARREAGRLEKAERARAATAIAARTLALEPARVWEALSEVARAAEEADDFTGGGAVVGVELRTRSMAAMASTDPAAFNLTGLFAALADLDFERAAQAARAFSRPAPRAAALLAVARKVLVREAPRPATGAPKPAPRSP